MIIIIIIRDNKPGTYMLIDVAITGDRNVMKKEAEKILKCKHLLKEIWATGTTSESLRQYLSTIPGNHKMKELQKQPYRALHTDCGKC
jgi:hypothetical protein